MDQKLGAKGPTHIRNFEDRRLSGRDLGDSKLPITNIYVRLDYSRGENPHLRFVADNSHDQPHPVECSPSGDLHIYLDGDDFRQREVWFFPDHEDLELTSLKVSRIQNSSLGPGETPFTVLKVDPIAITFLVEFESAITSLGCFSYQLAFTVNGKPSVWDPRIHNQGTGGPGGCESEHECPCLADREP